MILKSVYTLRSYFYIEKLELLILSRKYSGGHHFRFAEIRQLEKGRQQHKTKTWNVLKL